jgi:hypothetical protein
LELELTLDLGAIVVAGYVLAVILPGTDLAGAVSLTENLRRDIPEGVAVTDASQTLTASFGVAEHHPGRPAELVIGVADRALPGEGRDRVNAADVAPADRLKTRSLRGKSFFGMPLRRLRRPLHCAA